MRRWIIAPIAVMIVAGCSSNDDGSATTTAPVTAAPSTGPTTESTTDSTTDSTIGPSATVIDLDIPEGVRPEQVLLAAAILATGDIDEAVAQGLVTPAEVDAAVEAIAEDDLGRWQQLAEQNN